MILNGPNLHMLGTRQPEVHGRTTLADIEAMCLARAGESRLTARCRQSNSQGEAFRHRSYISRVAHGAICGFGAGGYPMALDGLAQATDKGKQV